MASNHSKVHRPRARLTKVQFAVGEEFWGESGGLPYLAKNERDTPNFLYAALDRDRVCAFLRGKAHEVRGTHETTQEIGDMGHPRSSRLRHV